MADLYVGRQPIFNRKLKTHAYELLYRDSAGGIVDLSGEEATSRVINALSEIGLEQLVGQHEAYINVTEPLLHEDGLLGILPRQCVLEVKSSIEASPEIVTFLKKFSESGYRIALDNPQSPSAIICGRLFATKLTFLVAPLPLDSVSASLETIAGLTSRPDYESVVDRDRLVCRRSTLHRIDDFLERKRNVYFLRLSFFKRPTSLVATIRDPSKKSN